MYLEFMKSFFSPIRPNWLVLVSCRPPEPKNVWFPLSRHDVPRVHEKFFVADSSELMGVTVISASWAYDSQFLDRMYVELIKNFFLADSRELMSVCVISASWAQKGLIPTF